MSTTNAAQVAGSNGKMIEVNDVAIPATEFFNFVESNRKDYFEDHSYEWCVFEIFTRGKAEITRQVKTAKTQAQQRAAGEMLRKYNLTPAEAAEVIRQAVIRQAQALQAAQAKATNGQVK